MKSFEEIKQNKYVKIIKEGMDGIGGVFYDKKSRTNLNFILSSGAGWEHCSVSITSYYKRCPDWEQMCAIKDAFWNKDECCIEYHPAESDYVNNHKYCLHIWKPIGVELPKPPSIMVGIKDSYSSEELSQLKEVFDDLPRW